MNRSSHITLDSLLAGEPELEKENGIYSEALNSRNRARLSQQTRAPFGEVNVQTPAQVPQLKRKSSAIDPSVVIKVKNIR